MKFDEIVKALKQGKNVHWINTAYKVFLEKGILYVFISYNMSACGLQESQYEDCFIGDD